MALTIYTEKDCKNEILKSKTIGVIGFGAQGKAQAQNLRDSGYKVIIGLKKDSKSIPLAENLGFKVCDLQTLAQKCDMLVFLLPDELQEGGNLFKGFFMPLIWEQKYKHIAFLLPDEWHKEAFEQISPLLQLNQILCFSHGFSVHFKEIIPPSFVDVVMIAPKAAGHAVRSEFLEGRGVISLIGIHQNSSGYAEEIALEYACALGSGKSAIFKSSFKDECECDLFSEQSVICGGIDALIRAGFETLVESGYPPEIAYFECLHEVKLVVDLIYTNGLESMRKHISNTAEYGDITAGEKIITQEVKNTMKKILQRIQNGEFAKEFLQERDKGFPTLQKEREKLQNLQIEITGKAMRGMMPWLKS